MTTGTYAWVFRCPECKHRKYADKYEGRLFVKLSAKPPPTWFCDAKDGIGEIILIGGDVGRGHHNIGWTNRIPEGIRQNVVGYLRTAHQSMVKTMKATYGVGNLDAVKDLFDEGLNYVVIQDAEGTDMLVSREQAPVLKAMLENEKWKAQADANLHKKRERHIASKTPASVYERVWYRYYCPKGHIVAGGKVGLIDKRGKAISESLVDIHNLEYATKELKKLYMKREGL